MTTSLDLGYTINNKTGDSISGQYHSELMCKFGLVRLGATLLWQKIPVHHICTSNGRSTTYFHCRHFDETLTGVIHKETPVNSIQSTPSQGCCEIQVICSHWKGCGRRRLIAPSLVCRQIREWKHTIEVKQGGRTKNVSRTGRYVATRPAQAEWQLWLDS